MDQANLSQLEQRLITHIQVLYPEQEAFEFSRRCLQELGLHPTTETPTPHRNIWDESDIMLITYGDSLRSESDAPLKTLHTFLQKHLKESLSAVHLLPFFPYSSDDGFSVMDYTTVNPSVGQWDHITDMTHDFKVMGDLVINHCSSRSLWFENYKKGITPGAGYFKEASPETDLSAVVRPRTSPLLREVETKDGKSYFKKAISPRS